jgi:tetratricopeptide (TPR) repeat protein
MTRARTPRRPLTVFGALLVVLALSLPAAAQSTGQVRGKVVDGEGKVVEGAKITIEFTGGVTRRHETKTNRRGEFIQIGLQSGPYRVTAEHEDLTQTYEVQVQLAQVAEVSFVLAPGLAAPVGPSPEEVERMEALRQAFVEAAAASDAGRYDEAIAKFNEVLAEVPKCAECHANIGAVHARQKQWKEAETAYRSALEINPELVDAYNGLATIYNAQGRFDEAAAMGSEASKRAASAPGGAGAGTLYNQGVIYWNSNRFTEAMEQFELAVQADPKYAQAHFMLGRVYLNLGKLPEALKAFETYLEIEPQGSNAAEATEMVGMLQKMTG